MSYVDGYVLAVPRDKKDAYRAIAERAAVVFRRAGALEVVECWADDVPVGVLTSFPRAVQATPEEEVVFSWIVWPSRAARDEGNAKAMADPALGGPEDAPFDGKRMIFGGFEVMLKA